MRRYRLRGDLLWRLEDGHLMVLDPATRSARFYHAGVSALVAPDGAIDGRQEAAGLLRDLSAMGLLERSAPQGAPPGVPGVDSGARAAVPTARRSPGLALSAPLNVTIQVTNACNLTCAHCHDPGAQVRHMKYDDFQTIVTELRSMRVFNVNLSGGEALLHRRILDMVGLVYSLGMKVTMSTNCTLVDQAKAVALRTAGLRQVHISLDSHDPTQHDAMRGEEGSFARMTANLAHLRDAGIEYTLVTTLRGQPVADYEATVDKACELGASAHKTNTLVPQGRGHALTMPSVALTRAYIAAFRRKQAEYSGRFRLLAETMFALQMSLAGAPGVPRVLDVGCPAGIMTCGINERGDVMPCSFFTELTAGNALQEGFRNVWENGPLFGELRKRERDGTCCECSHSRTCGGCRARSYGMHGELHRDDPYCSVAPGTMPERARGPQFLTLLSGRPE